VSTEAAFERVQRARFLARLQADLARLRSVAPRIGDDPAAMGIIEALAHGLAGAGGTFGFMPISEQAERVEMLAEGGDAVALGPALAALDAVVVDALRGGP